MTNLREQQTICQVERNGITRLINKLKNWRTSISAQHESWVARQIVCMVTNNFCTYITMEVDEVWHPESLKKDKRVEKNELAGLLSMLKI